MKNTIYVLLVIVLSLSIFTNCNDKKKEAVTVKKEIVKIDFNKEPVKFMGEIFRSYHDWKLEKGIALSNEAILIIDEIYKKNPEQAIKDSSLKLNKAFQIKSTLHTLKGMLLFRTSLHSKTEPVRTENEAIMNKVKKGEEITDKDFEDLANKIDKNTGTEKRNSNLDLAKKEFLDAIKADKDNPSPHYHLAEILKKSNDNKEKQKAEDHYLESARLSIQEGDYKSIDKILTALKGLNPKSKYLKEIEAMNKGVKDGIH